jgi:hypothetical protein
MIGNGYDICRKICHSDLNHIFPEIQEEGKKLEKLEQWASSLNFTEFKKQLLNIDN